MDKNFEEYVSMAKAYHDKEAKKYDQPLHNEVLSYDELYNYITSKIDWHYIEKYLPSKGLVLDAAGGTARWAIPIAKKGLKVVLIDISEGMLEVAKEKIKKQSLENRITLEKGDIHRIVYPDNFFDFALAMGIEYCPNLERVVGELARVIKPNCYLEFSVDSLSFVIWASLNEKNLEGVLKVLNERRYLDDGSVYCWVYTPSQLRHICEKNSLKVEKVVGGGMCSYIKDPHYRKTLYQNKEQLQKLLEIEMNLSEIEDMAILSSHPIVIAQKQ